MIFESEFVLWIFVSVLIPHSTFSIIFLVFKKRFALHDKFAIGILLCFILAPVRQIYWFYSSDTELSYFLRIYGYHLLLSPLLYYFCKSLVIPEFRLKIKDSIHILPFLTFSLFFLIFQTNSTDPGYYTFVMNPTREISIMGKLIAGINFFVMIFYSVLTVRLVNIHKIRIQEYLSNITNQETLTWLYWVIASFYGTLFLTVTITILTRLTQVGILEIQITLTGFNIMFWSIFTFLAYCMSFFFLRQGPIFPGLLTGSEEKDNSDRGRDPQSLGEKYKKSGLSEATKQDIYDRLHRLIKEEKPYLDEELNLKKLSESLGVSVNHLSQVINEMENQSFYYFVNQCRSREAMRLIEGDPNQGKKLIEIAYESGFNSLSSFNLHFKRVTGMTPREFRNLCSNKKSESPV